MLPYGREATIKRLKGHCPGRRIEYEMIDTSNKSDMKMGKRNIGSFLKLITLGERVWLRDDVLKQITHFNNT